jgi:hypothetical protein
MGNEYAGGIYVIAATKDGRTEYCAVLENRAIEAVRDQIGPGWKLSLTTKRLTAAQVAELKMRTNSVRQLKRAP